MSSKVHVSYQKLMSEEDVEQLIDKFVTQDGDPDAGKFLGLVRRLALLSLITASRQLTENRRLLSEACEAGKKAEMRVNQLNEQNKSLKAMLRELRVEADELRAAQGKSTPYNPRLKAVFEQRCHRLLLPHQSCSVPKRPSLGFDESLIDFKEDLIQSAFRRPRGRPLTSTQRMDDDSPPTQKAAIPFPDFDEGEGDDSVGEGSTVKEAVESIDGRSFEDVSLPQGVLKRLQSGSPKKKNDGTGCTRRIHLQPNIAFGEKSKVAVKAKKSKMERVPSARISQFFTRLPKSISEEVIDLSE